MKSLLIILLLCFAAERKNPREECGERYEDAYKFYKRHYRKISNVIEEENGDQGMVMAVGFPELIRYSMWKDMLETKANELLYVKNGKPYTFFSIGRFQIKPSFIEKIEKYIKTDTVLLDSFAHIITYEKEGIKAIRAERIDRLKDYTWQIRYIATLIKIVDHRFYTSDMTPKQRVEFYSSAYNHDFLCDSTEIVQWAKRKYFPYGAKHDSPFAYSEVAWFFLKNDYPELKKKKFFWW